MDEKKNGTVSPAEESNSSQKKTKVKIRLQNPIVKETVEIPDKKAPAEGEENTKQRPRWLERTFDVLKGVGIGVGTVAVICTAYVLGTNKPEPEPVECEEDESEYPSDEEEEEEKDSEEPGDSSSETE